MKSNLILAAVAAAVLASPALATADPAQPVPAHFKGDKLASKAKLTLTEAEDIAVKARPGTVTDRELEREKGGSGLRYSFDIKAGGATYEVGVDAKTGAVLENGAEGKNAD